jgi:hypothetical protein
MAEKLFSLIDGIIEDLVSQESSIESALLKTQVLAFKLKNEKLKTWVNFELNGYEKNNLIPNYRIIGTQVKGDLFQGLGFGGYQRMPNSVLPIELLDDDEINFLTEHKFEIRISQLQELAKSESGLIAELPYSFLILMSEKMSPWEVIKAWKAISPSSVTGVISTIKSSLINFLLELKEELGDENIPFMKKKEEIDKLIEKNIWSINAQNVNISIGNENAQVLNTGKKSNMNTAQGKKIKQSIENKPQIELSKFILELKSQLDNISLGKDDQQDITNEISRIETQLERVNPKYPIINEALNVINGILIGVVGNVLTAPIIEKLTWFIKQFSG